MSAKEVRPNFSQRPWKISSEWRFVISPCDTRENNNINNNGEQRAPGRAPATHQRCIDWSIESTSSVPPLLTVFHPLRRFWRRVWIGSFGQWVRGCTKHSKDLLSIDLPSKRQASSRFNRRTRKQPSDVEKPHSINNDTTGTQVFVKKHRYTTSRQAGRGTGWLEAVLDNSHAPLRTICELAAVITNHQHLVAHKCET